MLFFLLHFSYDTISYVQVNCNYNRSIRPFTLLVDVYLPFPKLARGNY
jgi:hypothetical protein